MTTIDFTDGSWVRDRSEPGFRRQVCGCAITYIAGAGTDPPGWMWTRRCGEHKETA